MKILITLRVKVLSMERNMKNKKQEKSQILKVTTVKGYQDFVVMMRFMIDEKKICLMKDENQG